MATAPGSPPPPLPGDRADWIRRNHSSTFIDDLTRISEDADIQSHKYRGGRRNLMYLPLTDLPYRVRDDFKSGIMDALRIEDYFNDFGLPTEIRPDQGNNRAFSAYTLPRETFTSGNATPAHFALVAQSLQVDSTAQGAEQLYLSGRQLRPETIQNVTNQLNNKIATSGKSLVFDVESAGLEPEKGIWQLAANLYDDQGNIVTRADGSLASINLHFDRAFMDAYSKYGDLANPQDFKTYYQNLRGGQPIEWIGKHDSDVARGIRGFLEMAQEADHLVGQGVEFDIGFIEHMVKQNSHYLNDTDGFKTLVDDFITKAKSPALVDTRLLSMALLGEETDAAGNITKMNVSKALQAKDQFTRYSVENMLLRTSFLKDAKNPQDIINKIQTGLHFGDIDVPVEYEHLRLLQRVANGENVLQIAPKGMSDADWLKSLGLDPALTADISAGTAVTPFTRGEDGLTPIQRSILLERKAGLEKVGMIQGHLTTDMGIPTSSRMQDQMFHTGIYDRWMDTFMTDEQRLARRQVAGAGFDAVQARAIEAQLPFAHLSGFERGLTTMLSRTDLKMGKAALIPGNGVDQLHRAKALLGDVLQTTRWQSPDTVRVYSSVGDPRNVAIPLELVHRAEREGVFGRNIFQGQAGRSNWDKVIGTDTMTGIQAGRISPFEWMDEDANAHKDIAALMDFSDDKAIAQEEIDRLSEFLRKVSTEENDFGLSKPGVLDRAIEALKLHGMNRGIQIGTIGSGSGGASVSALYDYTKELGMDVDRSGPLQVIVDFFGQSKKMAKVVANDRVFFSGPARIDMAKDAANAGSPEHILSPIEHLAEMNRVMQMNEEGVTVAMSNPALRMALAGARRSGNVAQAQRIYKYAEKGIRNIPKAAGIAGLALGAYYMTRKFTRQNEYDETFEAQPYEDPDFYNRYKQEMGEPMMRHTPSRNMNALQTAGMVQGLHNEKTKHHVMGSSKYDHLYQGV